MWNVRQNSKEAFLNERTNEPTFASPAADRGLFFARRRIPGKGEDENRSVFWHRKKEREKERETRNWVLEKRDDENLFRDFGKEVGSSLFHSPPKFLGARSEKAITGRVSRRRQQQPVQVEAEHTDPIHKMKKKKTIPLTHTHVHSETAKAEAMFVLFARLLAL